MDILDECETFNGTREGENKFELCELITKLPFRLPGDRRFQRVSLVRFNAHLELYINSESLQQTALKVSVPIIITEKRRRFFRTIDGGETILNETSDADEEMRFYSDLIKRKAEVCMIMMSAASC